MELYFTLAGLYLVSCVLRLPASMHMISAWDLVAPGRRSSARLTRGGDWRLMNPWPAALVLTGRAAIPADRPPEDLVALRCEIEEVRNKTRALRWLSSTQLVWVIIAGPTAAVVIGPEASILIGSGPALALHLLGIFLLHRAARSLGAADAAAREQIWVAALYPPSLLRAGIDLERRVFAERQIGELGALMLGNEQLEIFLRREIGRLRSARFGSDDHREKIAWLLALATQRGIDPIALESPRRRTDPTAWSYCEACEADYVAGFQYCNECRLVTTAYPEAIQA